MIGRSGQEPDQHTTATNNNNKDLKKDLSIKEGQEQAQNKERNRITDKMPEIGMKKVGQGDANKASRGTWNNPVGIEVERQDEIQKVDYPDRTDKRDRNSSNAEFHSYQNLSELLLVKGLKRYLQTQEYTYYD